MGFVLVEMFSCDIFESFWILTFVGFVLPEFFVLVLITVFIIHHEILLPGFGDSDGTDGQPEINRGSQINCTSSQPNYHILEY